MPLTATQTRIQHVNSPSLHTVSLLAPPRCHRLARCNRPLRPSGTTFESITLDAASDLLASLDVDHSINLTPGTVYGAVMGNAIHTASGTRIFGDTCATPVDAVPEQQNYALMLAGLGAIGFVARRRRAK